MLDAKAEEIEFSIAGRDFTIRQSPGILQSDRTGGTTGAAVWRASVHFAEWLAAPGNVLLEQDILNQGSTVLELGSGISGHIAAVLGERVKNVIATDQQYVVKILGENIRANSRAAEKKSTSRTKGSSSRNNIDVLALDWEKDDIAGFLRTHSLRTGVDAVVICDCIFNYALIEPLVQTCLDLSIPKSATDTESEPHSNPTVFIIAQQLRQPDVFEQWIRAFIKEFRVWRLPVSGIDPTSDAAIVVHVGIRRSFYLG